MAPKEIVRNTIAPWFFLAGLAAWLGGIPIGYVLIIVMGGFIVVWIVADKLFP